MGFVAEEISSERGKFASQLSNLTFGLVGTPVEAVLLERENMDGAAVIDRVRAGVLGEIRMK
jgi:hypothetical protein